MKFVEIFVVLFYLFDICIDDYFFGLLFLCCDYW